MKWTQQNGWYVCGTWRIGRMEWKEQGWALTSGRSSYRTRRKVYGWAVYDGGEYKGRAYTLALAKELAEELAG